MRLICSPMLTDADRNALSEGNEGLVAEDVGRKLREDFLNLISTPHLEKPARVLASLIAMGVIDLRLAFITTEGERSHRRLFHDKVGIFRDTAGDRVVFKGSMNETYAGLANDGNLESVDVSVSWAGDWERQRVETEEAYFEKLWSNVYPGVNVRKVPEVAEREFLSAANGINWPDLVDEIVAAMQSSLEIGLDSLERRPRPHQVRALSSWKGRGRRGILEHATGSGKTFTALLAIREALSRGETPLVLVPSSLLLSQWEKEIRQTLGDMHPSILVCGDDHSEWRSPGTLRAYSRQSHGASARIILSTMQTASRPAFRQALVQGQHLFLVADEVHRLGSRENRKILEINTGPRLGLSATPKRAGDPEGTAIILDYFQGIVPPPYTLADAIRDGTLTPYTYRPYSVSLTEEEQAEWNRITDRIRRVYSIHGTDKPLSSEQAEWVKLQLIRRARIIKGASQKTGLALRVVHEHFREGQHWLIYCDNQIQVADVLQCLRRGSFPAYEYHTGMLGDQEQTLRFFRSAGGILVAIKCLDEGVDIPAVSHALILASSQNPREFIQRRGRVLRRAPGKHVAHIFDAIVLPEREPAQDPPQLSIIEAELARSMEFAKYAINVSGVGDLERFALRLGRDLDTLVDGGIEEDG